MECAQQKYILRLHSEARETLLSLLSFPAGTVDAAYISHSTPFDKLLCSILTISFAILAVLYAIMFRND